MKKSVVFALIVCVTGTPCCLGFPGPPMSLVDRWKNSNLVVLADVTSTGDLKVKRHPAGQHVMLSIRKVLKGPAKQSEPLQVFTVFGSPAPFHFRKGQRLLLFLRSDDRIKMHTPIAFDGCIEADETTFQAYAAALKKLTVILEESDPGLRKRRLIDWHVDIASRPVTRRDAIIGLSYLRGKTKGTPEDPITEKHRDKLVATIVSEKQPGLHAEKIASFLQPYSSRALDEYLLESLRRSHEPGWSGVTRTAVEQLPGRLGIELKLSTRQRLDEWGELLNQVYYDFDNELDDDQREDAKERFHILWGSLSREIYQQCRLAVRREKPLPRVSPTGSNPQGCFHHSGMR